MELILIRHAESNWNKTCRVQGTRDPHLSEIGRRQGELIAQRFNNERLDIIYASPLKRAYQTAEILAKKKNVRLILEERLKEINLGEWQGKTLKEINRRYGDMLNRWYEKPEDVNLPGGERLLEFKDRVVNVFTEIKRRYFSRRVVVVTHGGVISIYLVHLLGMNPNRVWRIALKNASISIIKFYGEVFNLALFNDTCHLSRDISQQVIW
ncbi:MAG: histidine phosphatase family protein [bacterium]|nr:histidine phosphatase family protein [bacterium]